jgi:hypothetical protein
MQPYANGAIGWREKDKSVEPDMIDATSQGTFGEGLQPHHGKAKRVERADVAAERESSRQGMLRWPAESSDIESRVAFCRQAKTARDEDEG